MRRWLFLLPVLLSLMGAGTTTRCLAAAKATNASATPAPTRGPILVPMPTPAVGGTNAGTNAGPRMALRGERQRPVEIPDPWKRVWRVGFVLLVAGAALLAWWRLARRPPVAPVAEPLPDPAMVARSRIEAARARIGDPRTYASEVSDAVRHYLEDRFGLRAPEQTTEEFLSGLSRKPQLDPRHQGPLAAFLEQCDLVKFSGWRPGAQELDGLEAAAVWVVDETSPAGPWKQGTVYPPGSTSAPAPSPNPVPGGDHAV
jgi:hypothetical protein